VETTFVLLTAMLSYMIALLTIKQREDSCLNKTTLLSVPPNCQRYNNLDNGIILY